MTISSNFDITGKLPPLMDTSGLSGEIIEENTDCL